jgi:hypothetical protein
MIMSFYAKNDHPGILITCPHCKMRARHDVETIGDAIRDKKLVECVMCGKSFRVAVEIAADVCHWDQESDEFCDNWETDCGQTFVFEDGTPEENSHRFCSYCGKPIVQRLYVPDQEEV